MDATTSSAVSFPIMSASLRLEVVCIGARSIRCTYCRPRIPPRFNFTTNLVFFMDSFSVRALSILCSYQAPRSSLGSGGPAFRVLCGGWGPYREFLLLDEDSELYFERRS